MLAIEISRDAHDLIILFQQSLTDRKISFYRNISGISSTAVILHANCRIRTTVNHRIVTGYQKNPVYTFI